MVEGGLQPALLAGEQAAPDLLLDGVDHIGSGGLHVNTVRVDEDGERPDNEQRHVEPHEGEQVQLRPRARNQPADDQLLCMAG